MKVRVTFKTKIALSSRHFKGSFFLDMLKYVEGKVKPAPSRSVRTSLSIFLMKLRGGESNRILSTLFYISKSGIHRSIKAIRSALINGTFVSENLGFQHIIGQQIIYHHTRPLIQTLFGDTTRHEERLRKLTCVSYQMRLSFSYA